MKFHDATVHDATVHDEIKSAIDHFFTVDQDEGVVQVLAVIDKDQSQLAKYTRDEYLGPCAGCGATEGELHEWGCPWEFCPKCGHHDITECVCGLQSASDCAECGRWPFFGHLQMVCRRCAGPADFWAVPDDEWVRVTGPEYYHSWLCIPCFARMREVVDQHRRDIGIEHGLQIGANVSWYKCKQQLFAHEAFTQRVQETGTDLDQLYVAGELGLHRREPSGASNSDL